MGRSRGGLTTNIHAIVDAEGRPIALKLTAGQAHDGKSAEGMLSGLGEGQILLADRAYDSDKLRNRPGRARRLGERQTDAGAAKTFPRSAVSSTGIATFRAIATRYEKHAENYLALIKLAAVRIWIRSAPKPEAAL